MSKDIYKAGAYIRLSREDGNKYEESNSLKNQREIIKQYLENVDDISIYDYYADDGKTGTNFDRPGFQRMIKDMYDNKINCVIVKDLSRFGRNYIEVGRYIDYIFPSMNIRFISINDNIDNVKNPDSISNVIVPFKNLMNDEYCRDIAKKIKKVKEVQRLNGELTSGLAPYGYLVKDKKYIIDEEASAVVKKIFDLYLGGLSTSKIAYKLNDEKIDSPKVHLNKLKNKKDINNNVYWCTSKVNKILKCRNYIGELIQGKTTTLSNKVKVSTKVDEDNWVVIKNHHEPIIDIDTFNKVQDKLNENKNGNFIRNSYPSIFKGYLKCYDCKKAMVKMTCNKYNDKIYFNYDCLTYRRISKNLCSTHLITYDKLKQVVLEQITNDIDYLVKFEQNNNIEYSNSDDLIKIKKDIDNTTDEIKSINKMNNSLLHDLKDNLITIDDYKYYSASYDDKLSILNKKLNELKDQEFMYSQEERMIKDFILKFKKYIGIKELTEDIIKDLIEIIYIKKENKIEIKYLDQEVFDEIKDKEASCGKSKI